MSGPIVITLKDKLEFIESLLIPSFNPKYKLDTAEKRDAWMTKRAIETHWDASLSAELIIRYGTVDSLEEAKAERKKVESLFEKAEEKERKQAIAEVGDVVAMLRQRLGGADLFQKTTEVVTVYHMKDGYHLPGFGGKLRGRDGARRAMAAEADRQSAILSLKGALTKDEDCQVLCLWGVGTGKSRLLTSGLEAHREYCTDPALRDVLKDNSRCLQIVISFNNKTSYSAAESVDANKLLCRRLLKEVTGMGWADVLKLDMSAKLTAHDCLTGILQYHREVRGLSSEEPLFVFLGVDEVNKVTEQKTYDGVEIVKDITRALRDLHTVPRAFVATLIAGTHGQDINESMLGSGIPPVNLPYEPLSRSDINTILREDAGVCEEYMVSPDFQRVVDSTYPVLRPLGQLVASLPLRYDSSAVCQGEWVVAKYFASKSGTLPDAEQDHLLLATLTGKVFNVTKLGEPMLPGSSLSLDALQNRGTIQLVPIDADSYQVSLPLYQTERWLNERTSALHISGRDLVESAKRAAKDFNSFEQFTARFFSMKMAALRRDGQTTFTMADLLQSAHATADLAHQLFRIPAVCPLNPPTDVVTLDSGGRFPSDRHGPKLYQTLMDGGLVVNASGALVDIFAFLERYDAQRDGWMPAGLAIAPKKTADGGTPLSLKDVEEDCRKAVKAFQKLLPPHNQRSCTVIHFTNRELAIKDKAAETGKKINLPNDKKVELFLRGRSSSVIVDRQTIGRIVGPVLAHTLSLPRPAVRAYSTLAAARAAMAGVRQLLR